MRRRTRKVKKMSTKTYEIEIETMCVCLFMCQADHWTAHSYTPPSIQLTLCHLVSLSLDLHLYIPLSPSLYGYIPLSIRLSISLYICLSLCNSLSLSLCNSLSLFLFCPSLCLSLYLISETAAEEELYVVELTHTTVSKKWHGDYN